MSLDAGTRLGRYEIRSQLGAMAFLERAATENAASPTNGQVVEVSDPLYKSCRRETS